MRWNVTTPETGPARSEPDLESPTESPDQVAAQAAPADVTGARDALKEALEQKIVEAYSDHGHQLVMGIYYTEYVTQ